jgi:thiamine-phosphate pyrophosphorylase
MPAPDIGDRSRETPACDRNRVIRACGANPRFDQRRSRLAAARLYLVCDCEPGGRELAGVLRGAIAGGVEVVQLRDKHLSDGELTEAARAAHAICEPLGALLLVNDRPGVALAAGADGVHVGQEDMPVAQVRDLVGPDLLIGLSTHAPAEIDAATAGFDAATARLGTATAGLGTSATELDLATGAARRGVASVDYIGVGPVHATPTKPGRPAVGLELLRYAAEHSRLPFFAIGGIDVGNVGAVLAAGAPRVAVVRAIAAAADPELAARALREALDAHDRERELAPR